MNFFSREWKKFDGTIKGFYMLDNSTTDIDDLWELMEIPNIGKFMMDNGAGYIFFINTNNDVFYSYI